jgi:hypothetical protein
MPRKKSPPRLVKKFIASTGETRVVTPRKPRPGWINKTVQIAPEVYDAIMVTAAADERDFAKQCRVLLAEALRARGTVIAASAPAVESVRTPNAASS